MTVTGSGRPEDGVRLVELAEDYLQRRRLRESDDQRAKGNSHRARYADLCRWGRAIATFRGRGPEVWPDELVLGDDLGWCTLADLSPDSIMFAADIGRSTFGWKPATLQRMLATLRGFTRWLTSTRELDVDPCVDELVAIRAEPAGELRALLPEEVDAIIDTAAAPPPVRRPSRWPLRDLAIVELLARCGVRASELCALDVASIDTRAERPLLRIRHSKGNKDRTVPLPGSTAAAVQVYLRDRSQRAETDRRFAAGRSAPLFVRPSDGRRFDAPALDYLVRSLAADAGVQLPEGAAAHAFRHSYGSELALRGVPLFLIQQLLGHADPRTSAIYTEVSAQQLIAALDDAGML